jgi:D-glycero-alpha-D-manno-heptose 1-phosphate guanylyltransferase
MITIAESSAIILAGGLGTRLRAAVADRPKVMALVRGRPFLTFLLEQVTAAGFRHAVLCTGYKADIIENEIGQQYGKLKISYSRETEPLGTGGAIREAFKQAKGTLALAMNGDSICQADIPKFWAWHHSKHAAASLILTQVDDVSRYGHVETDEDDRVRTFHEKSSAPPAPGWINAGIYVLPRSLIETLPVTGAVSIEKQGFPAWLPKGIHGYRSAGRFIDIGTPESYAEAERVLE